MECVLCLVKRYARKQYSSRMFWVADCIACGKPIIVTTSHIENISERNMKKAQEIAEKLFGAGIKLRKEQPIIQGHWHYHIGI